MKLEYFVVYENNSDKFNIEPCWVKVNGHCRLLNVFLHLPQYKFSGPTTQIGTS